MQTLIAALQGDRPPGLYRLIRNVERDWLSAQAREHGWKFFYLEGKTIANKAEFLTACANEMNFPSYFGYNWDAFEECLGDLNRASISKFVILYNQPEIFAQTDHSNWLTALDILKTAVTDRSATDTPMYLLFKTNSLLLNQLEVL